MMLQYIWYYYVLTCTLNNNVTFDVQCVRVSGRMCTYVRRKYQKSKIQRQTRPQNRTYNLSFDALGSGTYLDSTHAQRGYHRSYNTLRCNRQGSHRRWTGAHHAFHLLKNASCVPRLSLGLFCTTCREASRLLLFFRLRERKHRPRGKPTDHPRPLSAWPLATDRRP